MKKKIIGIIQARVNSTRLEKKMLLPIGNHNLIEWVIKRIKKTKRLDEIILATTKKNEDNILIDISKKNKIKTFRGSSNNVLSRFYNTNKIFKGDIIVRICADNPFIDPLIIDSLICKFNHSKYEYANNAYSLFNSNYPDGFGAEIFTNKTLNKLIKIAIKKKHKEHLTSYLLENKKKFKIQKIKAPKNIAYPNLKFDIDTYEDYEKINNIVKKYNIVLNSKSYEIINFVKKNDEFNR